MDEAQEQLGAVPQPCPSPMASQPQEGAGRPSSISAAELRPGCEAWEGSSAARGLSSVQRQRGSKTALHLNSVAYSGTRVSVCLHSPRPESRAPIIASLLQMRKQKTQPWQQAADFEPRSPCVAGTWLLHREATGPEGQQPPAPRCAGSEATGSLSAYVLCAAKWAF